MYKDYQEDSSQVLRRKKSIFSLLQIRIGFWHQSNFVGSNKDKEDKQARGEREQQGVEFGEIEQEFEAEFGGDYLVD